MENKLNNWIKTIKHPEHFIENLLNCCAYGEAFRTMRESLKEKDMLRATLALYMIQTEPNLSTLNIMGDEDTVSFGCGPIVGSIFLDEKDNIVTFMALNKQDDEMTTIVFNKHGLIVHKTVQDDNDKTIETDDVFDYPHQNDIDAVSISDRVQKKAMWHEPILPGKAYVGIQDGVPVATTHIKTNLRGAIVRTEFIMEDYQHLYENNGIRAFEIESWQESEDETYVEETVVYKGVGGFPEKIIFSSQRNDHPATLVTRRIDIGLVHYADRRLITVNNEPLISLYN